MLTTYFKRQTTRTVYYAGPVGAYLDDFSDWLDQRGYRHLTIRHRLCGAAEFGDWMRSSGYSPQTLSPEALNLFRGYLADHNRLHIAAGPHSFHWLGAQLFFEFLQDQKIVTAAPTAGVPNRPELLQDFEHWMLQHRGVKPSTLRTYGAHITDLLSTYGENPTSFTIMQLRRFILVYAEHSGKASVKTRVSAVRAFLRFLIATERCSPGLDTGIPIVAQTRLATLPRYLPPEDVERIVAACQGSNPINIRDRAIILCLARLGLRASEVADLRLEAIDWTQGTLRVIGKSRREAKLPLPQDAGEAILHYLETARPAKADDHIFLTAIAPWTPITRYVVKAVAGQAIRRAGVVSPSFGAHVFRHSAATGWLRQGASLQVIGEMLRHRDIDTTAHYAKVDTDLLREVARPWPGDCPC